MISPAFSEKGGGARKNIEQVSSTLTPPSLPDFSKAAVAFAAYCRAARTAQRTQRLADGIAAGHAWAEFLDVFERGGSDADAA
jgi:hypothetical protein